MEEDTDDCKKCNAMVDNAAIDHRLIPCEPVWLATGTGVLASLLVSRAAKKYSFQVSNFAARRLTQLFDTIFEEFQD